MSKTISNGDEGQIRPRNRTRFDLRGMTLVCIQQPRFLFCRHSFAGTTKHPLMHLTTTTLLKDPVFISCRCSHYYCSSQPPNYGTNSSTVSTNQRISPYHDANPVSHQFSAAPRPLRENPAAEYSVEELEDQPLTSTYKYPADLHRRISAIQELVLSHKHEIREERRLRVEAEVDIYRDMDLLKRQMQYQR